MPEFAQPSNGFVMELQVGPLSCNPLEKEREKIKKSLEKQNLCFSDNRLSLFRIDRLLPSVHCFLLPSVHCLSFVPVALD